MSKSRAKGNRAEHDIVKRHLAMGIEAERMPLSGSLGGKYSDDVLVHGLGKTEVKCRATASGWKTLVKWLGTTNALFLKADRTEPLVLLPWRTYSDLIAHKYGKPIEESDAP